MLGLMLLAAPFGVDAIEGFEVAPRPAWTVPSDPAAPTDEGRAAAQDGAYVLLYDWQRRLREDGNDAYLAKATLITSRSGLEDQGRLELQFDPSDEVLSLHDVAILRDGERIEVLDGMRFSAARRETGMGRGVIDGRLTVFAEVPGLRVGDTLSYAMSWTEDEALWPGEHAGTVWQGWSVPSGRDRYRLLLPEGTALTMKVRAGAVPFERGATGGYDVYQWGAVHMPVVDGEDDVPDDHPQWASISWSTWADWSEVAVWGAALYDIDTALPEDLAVRLGALADEPAERRATAVIRMVQDEVRYVSESVGLGAFTPRAPAEVWARGWGDCKDKALLLAALLRAVGVDAVPALVQTDGGAALPDLAPSPTQFDHAVVRAASEAGPVWIDATRAHQGGVFPDVAQASFGYALALREGATLEAMAPKEPARASKSTRETYDFGGSKDGPVMLTIETTWRDGSADWFRGELDAEPLGDMAERYLRYYRDRYDELEAVGGTTAQDDRDANTLVVTERYRIPQARFADIRNEFVVQTEATDIGLPQVDGASARRAPVAIPHPVFRTHEIELLNWPLGFVKPEPFTVDRPEMLARFAPAVDGKDLTLAYEVRTLGDRVPAKGAAAYDEALAAWLEYEQWTFDLTDDGGDEAAPGALRVLGWGISALLLGGGGAALLRRR